MAEYPKLLKDEMVRATLAGIKTQTRMPVKFRDPSGTYSIVDDSEGDLWVFDADEAGQWHRARSPFGVPGDALWVRECWARTTDYDGQFLLDGVKALYRADNNGSVTPSRWRPSIHMPRWASRLTLPVKRVWVERVQSISNADVLAEGIAPEQIDKWRQWVHRDDCAGMAFAETWDSIYGAKGFYWAANPYVWACEFEVRA